jgi:hypothetical protein
MYRTIHMSLIHLDEVSGVFGNGMEWNIMYWFHFSVMERFYPHA